MFLSSLIRSMSGLATGSVPDDKSKVRILLVWGIPGEEGDMVVQVYLDRNIFNAGMVELVDTLVSGISESNLVGVRVSLSALCIFRSYDCITSTYKEDTMK